MLRLPSNIVDQNVNTSAPLDLGLGTAVTVPGFQALWMTHRPCPAAPEGWAKEVTVSRVCKHWKANDSRVKPGFVLTSGNNHTCPRLPPICFPFSEPLMQTRESAHEAFSHKDPRAAGPVKGGAGEPCHLLVGCPGTEAIAKTAVAPVIMTTYSF